MFQWKIVHITLSVCKAGYFLHGSDCVLCAGNTIKRAKGNATNCAVDPPCDGQTTVSNEERTACGMQTLTKLVEN